MILESPLKIKDDIQQLNKTTMPFKNGNADATSALQSIDALIPTPPIQRKTFPAKVSDFETLSSFVNEVKELSSSKRFSNPESSLIFLILC